MPSRWTSTTTSAQMTVSLAWCCTNRGWLNPTSTTTRSTPRKQLPSMRTLPKSEPKRRQKRGQSPKQKLPRHNLRNPSLSVRPNDPGARSDIRAFEVLALRLRPSDCTAAHFGHSVRCAHYHRLPAFVCDYDRS